MNRVQQLAEKLIPYAELEGSEIGEVCQLLINLAQYPSYVSDGFYLALRDEILEHISVFESRCKIVTTTKMVEQTYRELEWE